MLFREVWCEASSRCIESDEPAPYGTRINVSNSEVEVCEGLLKGVYTRLEGSDFLEALGVYLEHPAYYCETHHHFLLVEESPQCPVCDDCRHHCCCETCRTCKVLTERTCDACDRCANCCLCGTCTLTLRFSQPEFHPSQTFRKWASRRMAAAELELVSGQGRVIDPVIRDWGMSVVTDGSVEGGAEIRTAPANGDQLLAELDALERALTAGEAAVDERCGTHVHVDARDFTYRQLLRALTVYAWIEKDVFELVPPNRRENDYCKPRRECIEEFAIWDCIPSEAKQRLLAIMREGDTETLSPPIRPRPYTYDCTSPFCLVDLDEYAAARDRVLNRIEVEYSWSEYLRVRAEYLWQLSLVTGNRQLLGRCYHDTLNENYHKDYLVELEHYQLELKKYKRKLKQEERRQKAAAIRGGFSPFPRKVLHSVRPYRKKRVGRDGIYATRYYAFNLMSWLKHGTVEIRLHQGTANIAELRPWMLFWIAFFDEVKGLSEFDFSQDPRAWMVAILAKRSPSAAAALASRWEQWSNLLAAK